MRNILYLLIFISLLAISCTKGDPKLTEGKDFPLKLDLSQTSISVLSEMISISGMCDKRLSKFEFSFNDGVNWLDPSEFASSFTNNCKSSESFTLIFSPSNTNLLSYFTDPIDQSWIKTIQIRPFYSFGPGKAASFKISFTPQTSNSAPGMAMLSGYSDTQMYQSASYFLRGRIGVQSHLTTNTLDASGKIESSGGSYSLKMGILKEIQ